MKRTASDEQLLSKHWLGWCTTQERYSARVQVCVCVSVRLRVVVCEQNQTCHAMLHTNRH